MWSGELRRLAMGSLSGTDDLGVHKLAEVGTVSVRVGQAPLPEYWLGDCSTGAVGYGCGANASPSSPPPNTPYRYTVRLPIVVQGCRLLMVAYLLGTPTNTDESRHTLCVLIICPTETLAQPRLLRERRKREAGCAQ